MIAAGIAVLIGSLVRVLLRGQMNSEVLDAATNAVIDTRDVDDFSSGHYLVWKLRGHVKLKLTHKGVAGSNAVVSGLFFN